MGKTSRQHRTQRRQAARRPMRKQKSKSMKSFKGALVRLAARRAGVFYSPARKSNNQPLRNLVQDSFPHICKLGENKCQRFFVEAGVVPTKTYIKKDRWCWSCHQKLSLTSEDAHRCYNRACPVSKTRVRNDSAAHTPLWVS